MHNVKVFRDSVHGYIEIPLTLVDLFVDTELFQRLRCIEQTGMRILYPSARHDRFIHSLGTYYLGCKASRNFRNNVQNNSKLQNDPNRKHYYIFGFDSECVDKAEKFWDKCELLFQIACLLHDCGHAPFSHTFEFVYDFDSDKSLEKKLLQCLATAEFKADYKQQGSQHEKMSALMVCTEYWNNINQIIKIYDKFLDEDKDDVEFVARMIIGCKYTQSTKINQVKNCFIDLLNSKSIDVDSLDYIIRDSKLSGIDNISLDVDRLLSSLTIVEKTTFENSLLRNVKFENNVLNGMLISSSNVEANVDAQCKGGEIRFREFNGSFKDRVSVQGDAKINKEFRLKKGANNVVRAGWSEFEDRIGATLNEVPITIYGVPEDKIELTGRYLKSDNDFNGRVNVTSKSIEIKSTYIEGHLTGIFSGEVLGCYNDLNNARLSCELGFHKSSLSVIENVVMARNYEYHWVYSHHKVVYYANYLLIEILRSCINYLLKLDDASQDYEDAITNILSWKNMITDEGKPNPYPFYGFKFYRVTDSDIIAFYKSCKLLCVENDYTHSKLYNLIMEYETRKYKRSLWKSYAEFNIFFSDFSEAERDRIAGMFFKKSKHTLAKKYGCFNDDWVKAFEAFNMKHAVWVQGDSKLKYLDPDKTFILFKDKVFTFRTVNYKKDWSNTEALDILYFYYEPFNPTKEIDIRGFKDFIRNELKTFND